MVRADGCFQIQSCTPRARSRPSGSGATSALRPQAWPDPGAVRGPRSRDAPRTQQGAGPSAGLPARRHTPPAFSTVGFVAACLQKKLTKVTSLNSPRAPRPSGKRGSRCLVWVLTMQTGTMIRLSPYRSRTRYRVSHQPVSTVGCVYAPIASAAEVRRSRRPGTYTQGREGRGGATGGARRADGRVRGVY